MNIDTFLNVEGDKNNEITSRSINSRQSQVSTETISDFSYDEEQEARAIQIFMTNKKEIEIPLLSLDHATKSLLLNILAIINETQF